MKSLGTTGTALLIWHWTRRNLMDNSYLVYHRIWSKTNEFLPLWQMGQFQNFPSHYTVWSNFVFCFKNWYFVVFLFLASWKFLHYLQKNIGRDKRPKINILQLFTYWKTVRSWGEQNKSADIRNKPSLLKTKIS